jgi:pimeloyl-ACP methyl ester carboxylesterase
VSEPRELRIRANGLLHRALAWGPDAGSPVLLAHGFLDHAWSFDALARRLAAAGRLAIAFDWRGHGESEWIGPGGYYHFADYVLDLAELVPRLVGSRPFDLLGHSMGGTACAMWAGTRQRGLRRLVLCEGLGPPASPPQALPERLSEWLASVARVRSAEPAPMRDLDEAVRRLRARHPTIRPELARFLAEKGTRDVPGGRVWRFDPLHRTRAPMPFLRDGFVALLARIEVPVLLVSGERGFRTEDHAERVAAIRDAREVVLPGVGHMMHWEAPELLADTVMDFLGSSPP